MARCTNWISGCCLAFSSCRRAVSSCSLAARSCLTKTEKFKSPVTTSNKVPVMVRREINPSELTRSSLWDSLFVLQLFDLLSNIINGGRSRSHCRVFFVVLPRVAVLPQFHVSVRQVRVRNGALRIDL